ncbi:methyltransferase [Actinomadura rudentiformis]|uniref:Methyltransferase n=1 Tax=Actinomadura rudentiformis TaxID=359158 RepID=A0A6H9YUQ1_9ACTN|nr:methyltransferase [Actinomadura rudentiformis]KAB2343599.1 methyltransferase [Actinomadura rudentiformis]
MDASNGAGPRLGEVAAEDWSRLSATLRRHGWPLTLESYRQAAGLIHEPWLPPVAHDDPAYELLHLGEAGAAVPADLRKALDGLGLGPSVPFHLTSARDLFMVGDHHDRPERCGVYVGKDGMQIVDRLLSHRGGGRALDVGSGSGFTSVAMAAGGFRVTAIDISRACVAATRAAAALNGLDDRIDVQCMDAADALEGGGYEMIAANPPGAPVPPGLRYFPAGNGGPDGRQVIRAVFTASRRALLPDGVLVMRFESIGDEAGPFAVAEIDECAADASVLVTVEERLPMRVRSGVSARWSAPHNPDLQADRLLEILDAHAESLGARYFYTCFLVLRRDGLGRRAVMPFTRPASRTAEPNPGRPPTGLSELRWQPYQRLFAERRAEAADAARRLGDPVAAVAEVFADAVAADSINSRSLFHFLDELQPVDRV